MFADLPVDAIAEGHLSWDDAEVRDHANYLDHCEWYECKEGFLYIIDPEADVLIHGPDGDVADAMYGALLDDAPIHRLEEHVSGLFYIHYVLHRFSIQDGFYHA